jgi:very-short-patch-repair endonuclease
MRKKNPINEALKKELKAFLSRSIGETIEEVVFNKIMPTDRSYRADYCILDKKIIIEVNGGQYNGGRHTRAGAVKGKVYTQYENDLNKLNLAQRNGWKVFQFTYQMLARRVYLEILKGL